MTRNQQICEARKARWSTKKAKGICVKCARPSLHPTNHCALHQLLGRLGQIRYKYGLDYQTYQEMVERFGGCCWICRKRPFVKGLSVDRSKVSYSLHVDHDHQTKQVRGLLCKHCNYAVGLFQNDPRVVQAATTYLQG